LLREVGDPVQVVWAGKNFLGFFKADVPPRILPQPLALARIEVEAHLYNSYTTMLIAWEQPDWL